jgi:phage terminase large subunit-like protein
VYSSAGDREQASIVFDTAIKMIRMNRKLKKIAKIRESTKRILYPKQKSKYKVLSSETHTKHGLNPHCSVIDEVHVVPRELFEVLTQ